MIVKVSFLDNDSKKLYHYYWPENKTCLDIGTILLIKSRYGPAKVKINSYCLDCEPDKANSFIHIIKVLNQPKTESKFKFKNKKDIEMTTSLENVKNSVQEVVLENKDTIIKLHQGKAVITAIKTSLLEADFVPTKLKELIKIPGYSDIVIGMLLSFCGETFTNSEIILKAVKSANFAGAVEFSNKFTFIESFIESIISKALNRKNEKE